MDERLVCILFLFAAVICDAYHVAVGRSMAVSMSRKTTALRAVANINGLLNGLPIADLTRGTPLAGQELQCLFRASKDGFNARVFHERCDYNPPLPFLIVMKTSAGDIVGAYNPVGWQSRDDYRDSFKAFLFKISKGSAKGDPANIQKSTKIGGSEAAIYDFGDRAVWFADALFVPLNAKYMPTKKGRSFLGSSYSKLSGSGDRSLFGSGESEISDLECWAPVNLIQSSVNIYGADSDMTSSKENKKSTGAGFLGGLKAFENFLFGDQ